MRGLFKVLALSAAVSLLMMKSAKADPVLQRCFPKISLAKARIQCRLSDVRGEVVFSLVQTRAILMSGSGQYRRLAKTLKIQKIDHLEPRLSDVGVVDESIRFLAKDDDYIATLDIPCNQMAYGVVGYGKASDYGPSYGDGTEDLPAEHVASCKVN